MKMKILLINPPWSRILGGSLEASPLGLCYIVSDGGYFIIHGFIKEGTAAKWLGLHNWDIEVNGDDLLLTDKQKKYNRLNFTKDYDLKPVYKEITGDDIGDMYTFVFKKTSKKV